MNKSGKLQKLLFKKLSDNAIIPTKGSQKSAGYDLYSSIKLDIAPGGKALVKTDLAVKLPESSYGRVAPRSGLAWKHSIHVGAGVVDADYRGESKINLNNFNSMCCFI
jgi:dUTP pyrophosphatase